MSFDTDAGGLPDNFELGREDRINPWNLRELGKVPEAVLRLLPLSNPW